MDEVLFPIEAIALLRQARYDPEAELALDFTSGAFVWSDENYSEFTAQCRATDNQLYWQPVAFRDALVFGWRREACRFAWEALYQLCPDWPGFRPERSSEALRPKYEALLDEVGLNY